MEAHTPKRHAIKRFIEGHAGTVSDWRIRVIDEQENPIVHIEAARQDPATGDPQRTLEIHTRQVSLIRDEIDDSSKKLIRRWLSSLNANE
ncbi:MAG: hypothetical protein ACRD4P_14640 [Bryobacteraceae bacterium]